MRQHNNTACHKGQIISNWSLEHDSEFTEMPSTVTELNRIEQIWDVVEQHGCAADKSLTTLSCHYLNMDQTP